ncbi:transporter substrate-binding domain-containing protein [Pseudemcibacter aquimaris]|uniref:transporter substrate-binding domain-containing protein n=1 Tax=Pseudemcibacter aquimaris TaxID=2857064 RepID=UPI002011A91F|nr:transporter substrate-binding domain-containing protein [Pseudemcibacter aquimaris]MCC3861046.1 transporter substrate-binding domain-containing protein [Pseudemcibacter aquimaris]WDU59865.1 transporter substrate-binding domain-containing protein [Pseudemcibacter aquimaris]
MACFWASEAALLAQNSNIFLTAEEQQWIADNPVVRATFKTDVPPLEFVDNNLPAGFSVDYLNLVADKIGLTVEYVQGDNWISQLDMVKRGEIDIVHNAIYTEERSSFLNFTSPYLDLPMYYYGKFGDATVDNINEIMNKKIGGVTGWASTLQFKRDYPDLDFLEYPSMLAALDALSIGEVEVIAGVFPITDYIILQNNHLEVERVSYTPLEEMRNLNVIRMATLHENQILYSLIQKGLDAVTLEEYSQLSEKWYNHLNIQKPLILTPEELNWIEENKTVRVAANVDLAPIEFVNENREIDGISAVFLNEIEKKTGLIFEYVGNKDWDHALTMIRNSEADILSAAVATPEREEYLTFTDYYISLNTMIFARAGEEIYRNMRSLSGRTVAIERGSLKECFA